MSRRLGEINLRYGANEDDNWMDFAHDKSTHELHRQTGTEYIRVWISAPDWRESTIPLTGGKYDFTNLNAFIDAVLDSGAVPYVLFAHAPPELRKRRHGDSDAPPENIDEFAEYVQEIMVHLRKKYGNQTGDCVQNCSQSGF
jgi:hypothetical protein